jgi:hypothetical protein
LLASTGRWIRPDCDRSRSPEKKPRWCDGRCV